MGELDIKFDISFNEKNSDKNLKNVLKMLETNNKIALSLDANALSSIKTQIESMQKKLGEGTGTKLAVTFDKEKLDSQLSNIKAKLEKLGNTDVKVNWAKNNNDAIITYNNSLNTAIKETYTLGEATRKVNDTVISSTVFKKNVDEFKNANKNLYEDLEKRAQAIKTATGTKASIQITDDGKSGKINGAVLTWTDNVGKLQKEYYKLQTTITETNATIKTTSSFANTKNTFTDNIQKSITMLNSFSKELNKIKTKNTGLDVKTGENTGFNSNYTSTLKKINALKSAGVSISEEDKNKVTEMLSLLSRENDAISKNIASERIKEKAMQDEIQRVSKLGELKNVSVPTGMFGKSSEEIKAWVTSISGADAKINSFKKSADTLQAPFAQMVITTRNSSNELRQETVILDSNTNSLYRNEVALKTNTSRNVDFMDKVKNAWSTVTAFASISALMYKGIQEVQSGIQTVIELNSALTSINMTMEMSSTEMNTLTTESQNMAKQMGISIEEVMNAVKVYANANENVQSILDKTKADIMLATASGMNTTETTDAIQAIMNQFELETEGSAERIANTLEKVSANMPMDFGRGIKEMTEGIKISGSVAKDAGFELEQYEGVLGNIISRTRLSGSVVGNGLKTVMARLGKAKTGDASVEEISKAEGAYRQSGIELRDKSTGEFREIPKVLDELSVKWKTMTNVQKNYITEVSAGIKQGNIFKNMMNGWTDSTALYAKALDSSNFAQERQAIYLESTKAKIQQFKTAMDVMWQNTISSKGMNDIISVTTVLAKTFLNLKGIILLVATAFAVFNGQAIVSSIGAMLSGVGATVSYIAGLFALTGAEAMASITTTKLAYDIRLLGTAMLENPLGIALVAMTAMIAGLVLYKNHLENVKKANDELFESSKKIEKQRGDASVLLMKMDSLQKQANDTSDVKKSTQAKSDLLEVQKQMATILPNTTSGFTDEGVAVSENTSLIREQLELKKQEMVLNAQKFMNENKGMSELATKYAQAKKDVLALKVAQAQGKKTITVQNDYKDGSKTATVEVDISKALEEKNKFMQDSISLMGQYNVYSDILNKNTGSSMQAITLETKAIDANTKSTEDNASATGSSTVKVSDFATAMGTMSELMKTAKVNISEANSILDQHTKSNEWDLEAIIKLSDKYPDLLECIGNDASMTEKLRTIKEKEKNTVLDSLRKQVLANNAMVDSLATAYGVDVKNKAMAEGAKNQSVINAIKIRIQAYQTEMDAISTTSQASNKLALSKGLNSWLSSGKILETADGDKAKTDALKAKIAQSQTDLKNLTTATENYNKLKTVSGNLDKYLTSTGDDLNDGTKERIKAEKADTAQQKELTAQQKLLTAETKRATNATKDYETAMKSLSIQLKAQDISLGKLNENSSKYRSGLEKKAELLKADIKLTEQSIITNTKNAKALMNIEGKPNTSNTISSKNVASSAGQAVVNEAKKYLGTPYVWGGTNQEGFDCSGLVQFVYKKLGKDISRTTTTQINEGSKIAKKDLQVGDTVFFGNPSEPHHEGIYVGSGQYLHAPRTGDVVKISDLNSRSDFAGARRMVSGGTSIPSEIQGFMGDSTTDGGSDKILSEIENQRSHLVDAREELDKLKIEVLKSKVGVFDEQVAIYDKYINLNKAKSERFEVGSIGHTKAMNDELQAMTNKYINLTKKTQLLNEEIKSGGYDEKTVSDLKTQLLDTDSAYLDIYNNIRTLTKEIYANAFAENDKLLAKFESDAKKVDDSISLLGTIDTVKEMGKQLSLITDKKVIKLSELVKINHEMEALNEELKTINSTTTQGEIRLKAVTDRLKSLAETQVNLEISITTDEESINSIPEQIKSKLMEEANFVKSMQDKIGEVIKKRYEEEQKLAKENLDLKIKAREKEHKNIIAKLNEEKNAYKEFYELKLQDLDREKGQSQYESKISDLVKAKMILQKEYDSLLMDDSLGSKARRSELKEELSNSQEGINREQYDRNIELQKDNISALLKAEENKTDKEIKGKEELYDKDKEAFDISLKQIEKKYENLLKAENIYRESTKILIDNQYTDEEGHIIKLTELMTKFTDEWGDGLSAVGDKIKTELLDNIAKAQGYLGVESKTTKDERTQIKDMTDMSVYIDGIVYSLSEINGNPDKYKDIVANAKVVYVKGMNDEIWDDKASNANSTNKSMIESSEKKRIKEMKVMSAYVDGAIYSLNDLNSNPDKYKNITDKAKVVYIKGMDGDIWDGKTNKKESFSEGGVIDYTGDAKVHGSPNNSEVVFNSKQALGLYNFVKTMPVQSFNRNAISPPQFSQQSMESVVHLSVDNLINVNGNVDKESLPTLKEISKFVIGDIQKELNKTGIYRRV
ncbi:phage tail tape measure protein [Clostridium tagluense]|uniref:NlpC/P60 domain-containing protein n=1 Tax=Clostridium tagluense TaxID=360422 RepID=A0A401ULP4_9CLOT|nr:phage tail tape measure protein [Clostridium tagluense]GCD10449.1 hypothetical protein Ctaglu_20720 [Clostridium tagluense]